MRVLVTGSEGSLAQWTIKHLIDAGHDVVGLDNYERYDDEQYEVLEQVDDYEFHKVDLTNRSSVFSAFSRARPDVVLSTAALIYGVKGFHENCADVLSNDVALHRNVLDASRKQGVERVAYISSSMVYEQQDTPHREEDADTETPPNTAYGFSKLAGERYCRAYQQQYGIDYTVWRPFNIITPYEKAEDEPGVSHVFADFLKKQLIEQQNPMEIFGDGEQIRCFTWIDDIAEAIANNSFAPETRNEAYNLANVEPVTMKELAQRIHQRGVERGIRADEPLEFDHQPIYDDDVKERIPTTDKAQEDFGWNPEKDLDYALERCLDEMDELWAQAP